MRLDKFLKVARIVKRRTVANAACDADRVLVNDKEAKPSKDIKVGDVLSLRFGEKTVRFRVLSVPAGNVTKQSAEDLTEVVSD